MSHFDAQKLTIIDDFRTHPKDTGSPEVQIALMTRRIQFLTDARYRQLVEKLGLRG